MTQDEFKTSQRTWQLAAYMVLLPSLLIGCSDDAGQQAESKSPPVLRAAPSDEPEFISASDLRRRLRANEKAKFPRVGNDIVGAELFQSGVKSIEALRGLPLRSVDLGMTEVTDISPLAGMPLERVILENTKVEDIRRSERHATGSALPAEYESDRPVSIARNAAAGTKPAECSRR